MYGKKYLHSVYYAVDNRKMMYSLGGGHCGGYLHCVPKWHGLCNIIYYARRAITFNMSYLNNRHWAFWKPLNTKYQPMLSTTLDCMGCSVVFVCLVV